MGVKAELSVLRSVLGTCEDFTVLTAKLDQVALALNLSKPQGIEKTVNIAVYIDAYPAQPPVFVATDDSVPGSVETALEALSGENSKTLVELVAILYQRLGYDGDRAAELTREYEAALESSAGADSEGDDDDEGEEFDDIDDDEYDDDADDDDDAMFALDELDMKPDKLENAQHQKLMDKLKDAAPSVKKQSLQATDRLMKELQQCYRSENVKNNVYSIELMEDNIKEWKIRIFQLDKDSNIMKGLKILTEKFPEHNCIVIHASFTDEFPLKPPFFRVMSPLIQGGHVMSGGAICAEVLTSGGWSSAYSIDSLIIQVGQTITKQSTISTKGTDALNYGQYTKKNAAKSFSQLTKYHEMKGWGKQKMSDG